MYVTRGVLRSVPFRSVRHFFRKCTVTDQSSPTQGLFGDPLLKSAASLTELNSRVRAECSELLNQIEAGSKDRTTVQLFDDLSNTICKAADMVECVRQLHNDPDYNEAAQKSASDYCQLVESLNTYTKLYHTLKNSKVTEANRLDDVDKHTIDLFLNEFEQSGVHLPEKEREEFVRLSGEIFNASTKFQMGCDKEVVVSRALKHQYGLPSTRIVSPVSNCIEQEKRRFIHTTYYRHNDAQEENLRSLVLHRDELARLTGYPSYAHRAQENSLLGSYENAHDFLWGVIQACRPAAEREIAVLLDVQSQCSSLFSGIGEWDIHYLTQIYKERAYGIEHYEFSGTGLANLLNKLYGVRIEERPIERGEMWDGNIIKLDVNSADDQFLGTVYLDIDRRPTKAVGDCHFTVRCSKQLKDNSWQTPIVVLSLAICDRTDVDWRSVPIDMHRAENVFHEMGHAMHSMLGRTRYQHVAGTRCPQDFSEIPSILMEYFFNDLTVLQSVLRNSDGECVRIEDAASMIASRFAFSSLEIMQQASYALFDLELHAPDATKLLREGRITTTDLFHSIITKALPHLDRQADSAFQHRFHHLVQYGAKYYSYMVARSAASLIWNSKFRDSPFSRTEGEKWMKVQSHGGGLPSAVLLETMLGYSPTSMHFIDALKNETSHLANLGAVNV
uniref:Peptidase_M3 domain-containing protein n=1 Tax=Haemonchus contortus TaxID=6289 RepID=A0A7I4YMA9_HAECO